MYDVKKIGHSIKYVAAEPLKKITSKEKYIIIYLLLWDTIRALIQTFLLILKKLYESLTPKKLKNLNRKIALVTGGANGLGRAIAFELAKENCDNIIIADIDFESAVRTAEEIKNTYNIKCKGYRVDVSDYEGIEKLKEEINKDFGIVNILVNNAGIVPSSSLCDGNWKDIEQVMKVNIGSNIWPTLIFMKDMIEHKDGHIVAIASVAGLIPVPCMVTYTASKHAVIGFMSTLGDQLHIDGHNYIKTTTICPAIINTRKEYLAIANLRFPPMKPEYAAKKIVDAIKKEKELVIIMKGGWLIKLETFVPTFIRRLWIDIIVNPKKTFNCYK